MSRSVAVVVKFSRRREAKERWSSQEGVGRNGQEDLIFTGDWIQCVADMHRVQISKLTWRGQSFSALSGLQNVFHEG